MSHGRMFLSPSEKSIGSGVFGAFRQTRASRCAGGRESAFFSLSEVSLPGGCVSPPPPSIWDDEVTLTSNKDHSECVCAVDVLSALEG